MSGGSVTFAPGQLEAAIVVMVNGDTIVEPDEDFFVTLTAPVNARLGNESAHGLILNDDGLRRGRVAGH
jgi:chitinase